MIYMHMHKHYAIIVRRICEVNLKGASDLVHAYLCVLDEQIGYEEIGMEALFAKSSTM